ncbi:MAG: four helix bundle protein [Syntrophorhabdus sp.]|nr:four helix bundle protein [Syntrophorhabdus sp.]HNY70223.1 four helix bundle protein [Syntrophorhabdus sp.]
MTLYQMALDFNDRINITGQFPPEEKFSLVDQYRRASAYFPLNIVDISFRQKYLEKDVRDQGRSGYADPSRMIHDLLKSVWQNAEQRA